ncbi:hypothetical protein VB620_16585 [Nodularia harveyana UHCC-0300]|uniref:DUF3137 domain-containing protein n=1 Tax=Nodularia harveyana UHCC-0300 TaxID=2974287 RepID=A0ABU5UHB5_9CYAN|nr:hypothetical protein [Nodularia harveyana]MEA5582953.1 hypothetical protein [Nodularia harveyana UHCC-0300]
MPIELQELRKQLIYEETALFDIVKTDLDDIEALSQLAKIRQKKFSKQAFYYFIATVLLGFIRFSIFNGAVASIFQKAIILLLNMGLLGLTIACIYMLFMMFKFRRLNLVNYRYDLSQSLMRMLARDIDETNSIYLKLSFQKSEKNEYKTDTLDHPYKSGWKIDIYKNKWLDIKGRFLDKTRFVLTINELTKKQYGWKRSRSGKKKYKSKIKLRGLDINLILSYPQHKYGSVKILQNDVINAIKLPNCSVVRGIKITNKTMNLNVRISPEVSENESDIYITIVAMFLSLYQVLNLAKILYKEKS